MNPAAVIPARLVDVQGALIAVPKIDPATIGRCVDCGGIAHLDADRRCVDTTECGLS